MNCIALSAKRKGFLKAFSFWLLLIFEKKLDHFAKLPNLFQFYVRMHLTLKINIEIAFKKRAGEEG